MASSDELIMSCYQTESAVKNPMSRIKYNIDLMKYMEMFESLAGAKLKDCIADESNGSLIFIVGENEIGKAIGRGGSNVKRLESLLRRKIKIVEFSPDVRQFIRNFVMPLQVKDVEEGGNRRGRIGSNRTSGSDGEGSGRDKKDEGRSYEDGCSEEGNGGEWGGGDDSIITISCPDTKTRGMLIGRESRNLQNLKEIVGRYFKVGEIRVR